MDDVTHRKYMTIVARITSNTATVIIHTVEPRPNLDGDVVVMSQLLF
jgi:hypothetical protein